ncbi:unnamed protein product, partial [Pleuronectes platessa]
GDELGLVLKRRRALSLNVTATRTSYDKLQRQFSSDPDLDSAPPKGRPQPSAVLHGDPPSAQPPPLQTAQAAVPAVSQLYPDLDLPAAEGKDSPPAYSTPWSAAHTPKRTRRGTDYGLKTSLQAPMVEVASGDDYGYIPN